jgi:hypothetical protein
VPTVSEPVGLIGSQALFEIILIDAGCQARASSMNPAANRDRFRYLTECEAALPSCFDPSSNLNHAVDFLQCLSCNLALGEAARRLQ